MSVGASHTPRAEIDRARLNANCERMREVARRHGVRLRPHLKTAKCAEVAELALGARDGGLTVSTLEEARWFAARGFRDLTYAVGITPNKLPAADAIVAGGVNLGLLTDDVTVARILAQGEVPHAVWLEIDSGQGRGGFAPEEAALLEAAAIIDAGATTLRGVLTHAGQSYACRSPEEVREIAETERASAVRAAERIRGAGLSCPEASVGSTPTALHAESLEGVTEIRPGVYVFFDLFQTAIGSCTRDELALSVVASVVSRKRDHVWIDAGALALSSDRSMDAVGGSGYGEVTRLDGSALEARVVELHQEHGKVVSVGEHPLPLDELPVGAQVRIWPNHACMTAAMYDAYVVTEDGAPVARWDRLRG